MRLFAAFRGLLLRALYAIISALARIISLPRTFIEWLSRFRVELWIVEGEEQSSHEPLSILCASNVEDRDYVLQVVFGDSYRQRRLGRFWLWNLGRAIPASASACSMMIVDACESHLRFARPGNWFLIPIWVFGEVDLAYSNEEGIAGKPSKKLRKRIRCHSFTFEVTRDPAKFDDFYYNMYKPHITQTFGACAKLASYEKLKGVFQQSDLLLLRNQEQAIAGQLVLYVEGAPFVWALGIRDGNREHLNDGAAYVLHHFCFRYLHEAGHQKALLGWSRPFLRDGALQFKKHLSQQLVGSYPNGYAFRVVSPTPAVKAFLCNNPFIFMRRNVYYAAVFWDGEQAPNSEEVGQFDADYFHPGLARLLIYRLQRKSTDGANDAPVKLAEHIELRTLV